MSSCRVVIVLLVGVLFIAGCESVLQGLHNIASDPNTSGALESGAEGAAGVAGFFGPVGAAIGTGLLGALAVWRKMKPALASAKTAASQSHAAGTTLTRAIETFKTTNPDQWSDLRKLIEGQLDKQGIDPLIVKNVIRGLRGLPAEESL